MSCLAPASREDVYLPSNEKTERAILPKSRADLHSTFYFKLTLSTLSRSILFHIHHLYVDYSLTFSTAMDFTLRCNALNCRVQLSERAVVTTCRFVYPEDNATLGLTASPVMSSATLALMNLD